MDHSIAGAIGAMRCSHGAVDPKERYEELELRESLNEGGWRYAAACQEMAFILRNAYSKSPKFLQFLIFEDTLSAVRLLPRMPTQAAISSVNVLIQSAEFALPKHKKVLAVAEFKRAMVTSKRHSKSQQQEGGLLEFPQDVLMHVFGYLDLQSLVSAATVCKSWSLAASDDHLWKSMYVKFFGISDTSPMAIGLSNGRMMRCKDDVDRLRIIGNGSNSCWRDDFKSLYEGLSSKKVAPYRGYCKQCNSIVSLADTKCYCLHVGRKCKSAKVIPISMHQIVEYVLYGSLSSHSSESYSDSDSDSDDSSVFKLWAAGPIFAELLIGSTQT